MTLSFPRTVPATPRSVRTPRTAEAGIRKDREPSRRMPTPPSTRWNEARLLTPNSCTATRSSQSPEIDVPRYRPRTPDDAGASKADGSAIEPCRATLPCQPRRIPHKASAIRPATRATSASRAGQSDTVACSVNSSPTTTTGSSVGITVPRFMPALHRRRSDVHGKAHAARLPASTGPGKGCCHSCPPARRPQACPAPTDPRR